MASLFVGGLCRKKPDRLVSGFRAGPAGVLSRPYRAPLEVDFRDVRTGGSSWRISTDSAGSEGLKFEAS